VCNLPPLTPPYQGGGLKAFSSLSRRGIKSILLLIKEGIKSNSEYFPSLIRRG